jgi:GNAT superfamily N-acetyltransferase
LNRSVRVPFSRAVLGSARVLAPLNPVSVRLAEEQEIPRGAVHLLDAFGTDPDGFFAASDGAGPPVGLAAGAVREDVLVVLHLDVTARARGRGAGHALFAAVREYGASRGARHLEFLRPAGPETLGFLLSTGLPVRGLALRLRASLRAAPAAPAEALAPVPSGAPLAGWVADLDRETRGHARAADWEAWSRRGAAVLALRRRGRPEALGALFVTGRAAAIGPVEARTPAAAAEMIPLLAGEARSRGALAATLTLPDGARLPLAAAFRARFRLAALYPLLASRTRGDFRRYAASPTPLF